MPGQSNPATDNTPRGITERLRYVYSPESPFDSAARKRVSLRLTTLAYFANLNNPRERKRGERHMLYAEAVALGFEQCHHAKELRRVLAEVERAQRTYRPTAKQEETAETLRRLYERPRRPEYKVSRSVRVSCTQNLGSLHRFATKTYGARAWPLARETAELYLAACRAIAEEGLDLGSHVPLVEYEASRARAEWGEAHADRKPVAKAATELQQRTADALHRMYNEPRTRRNIVGRGKRNRTTRRLKDLFAYVTEHIKGRSFPGWTTLELGSFAPATTVVTAKLVQVDNCTGVIVTLCQTSNQALGNVCTTCSFAPTPVDFTNNLYYVEVDVTRPAGSNALPRLNNVRIF